MSKKADLFIIIVCSLLLVPLTLFTSGALRIVFSLAFVLFFPGYTLIAALPGRGGVSLLTPPLLDVKER